MNLEELKNTFKVNCLAHTKINNYSMGEEFDIGAAGEDNFPTAFLEIPYLTTYPQTNTRTKNINFALNIIIQSNINTIEDEHLLISDAETIGDQILKRIDVNNGDITFETITGLSLREFSDEDVVGMRFEFVVKTDRESVCDNEDNFSDC